jgi:ribose 1,5-bisphosphokinase PhnN|tara:strand:- start:579 stop:872 length:294 start_codon:yes stop_codon:yes gene_type:complete
LDSASLQIIAQYVLTEQRINIVNLVQAPYRQGIFRGDEAERAVSRPFHAPGQQHAQGLVRQAAFEGIANQIMLAAAWEALHQQAFGAGQNGTTLLHG